MMHGPNVKRLIVHKMSVDAVPNNGGPADAIRFLTTPGAVTQSAKAASAWVEEAIRVVRLAAEPNPWKQADDEAIAGELLRQIETRKRDHLKRLKAKEG